ncbi:MAG: MoaD/ThiS family protein [Porticoccaceae bacterium]|jgi:molybdopterin synthase sulfur carrier subunit|nr:MoaD/ThiS family protein [Porticoccaceae bacterium]|tara:strand:+ start:467 stop:718 length:252 start_codon:yes stop_codon:yes gene_type:complete
MLNFLFFGRLGDLASGIDKAIPYHIDLATPLAIRNKLAEQHPLLTKELSEPQVLVSVNKMIVKWDHPLFDGDEIAFLPPVTGG